MAPTFYKLVDSEDNLVFLCGSRFFPHTYVVDHCTCGQVEHRNIRYLIRPDEDEYCAKCQKPMRQYKMIIQISEEEYNETNIS